MVAEKIGGFDIPAEEKPEPVKEKQVKKPAKSADKHSHKKFDKFNKGKK